MSRADVLIDPAWVQAYPDDPGVMLAEANEGTIKGTRRPPLCSCRHSRDAHRHYRPGSDCAVCECPRLSPWNPAPGPAGRAVEARGRLSRVARRAWRW
jgi:hypothetical protein